MAALSSLGLNLRLADIDENLKSHSAALSWPNSSFCASAASASHDFLDDAPCFTYTEVFESGDVFQAVSPGSGVYLPLHSSSPGPLPAFAVSKCRSSKTIGIENWSLTLLQTLAIAMPSPFDFLSILSNYTKLKSHLQHLETISPSHPATVELRLLVGDLLLDRALYAGIGTETYRSNGHLSLAQLHDMHQRSLDAGLDGLDACFSLGLLPDVMDDAYLEALASKFTELALVGDMTALYNLCEPIVRSGEVEWEMNTDLLLQLLDRGRLDIYRYVLDLASRTRDRSSVQPASFLRDITHDPLHVAIRLGHVQQVDSLLQQGTSFIGVHHSDLTEGSADHVVLTPLSAAVYWRQPRIVRVILSKNIFADGMKEAVAMAVSDGDNDMMQILFSFGVMGVSGTPVPDNPFESFSELSLQVGAGEVPLAPPGTEIAVRFAGHQHPLDSDRPGPSAGIQGTNRQERDRAAEMPKEPLRDVCICSEHIEIRDVASRFAFADGVWGRGLKVFRGLMQDSPPSTLPEVVDSLVVANAIYLALFTHDETISPQFINDLDRWRSVLPASSQYLFDDVALRMWAYAPSTAAASEPDPVNVSHFQDLVQSLTRLEKSKETAPSRMFSPGSSLAACQRAFEDQETSPGISQAQAIPGRSQPCQSSYGGPPAQRDDLVWAEFLHMEQFEDMASEQTGPSLAEAGGWDDVMPTTMLLLVSVAFYVVLALILHLHSTPGKPVLDTFASTPGVYDRCCALLAAYLAMYGVSVRPPDDDANVAMPSFTPQSPAYGLDACITPSSSLSSLNTLGVRRNESLSSISSTENAGATSASSRDQHHRQQQRGERLPCFTPRCAKTFSSVSNRNKHLREGHELQRNDDDGTNGGQG
ncbi:uncharacterized protein GLRG_01196 [Colletotrichum graminicola M1.001]|uniref:C2H2-type domain-containing protein n=1 Tax=Colletotrichum graminicola (strain M1.001 / M2 / FGSC 10212) TaxID=645133 RepID=E3Q4N7_COLGM|nr:uncharacterized protein GLRG_01196 [Colletotrichum graminicola M1.001]EFQ26052.1 hypothetical protein GLRG_01196 [Colletotrichum graminicola M1.001]